MSRAVFALAQRFRRSLERAKASEPHLYVTLTEFPHGACGDASLLLLAKFFENNGQTGFDYVLGRREKSVTKTSHIIVHEIHELLFVFRIVHTARNWP